MKLPASGWDTGHERLGRIDWLPIVEFGSPKRTLGVVADWTWVLGFDRDGRTLVERIDGDAGVAVLPILELPWLEVESKLRAVLGTSAAGQIPAPLDRIYRVAFSSRSPYWVSAAAEWIASAPPVSLTSAEVIEVADSPSLKLDARARGLLRAAARELSSDK